MIAISAFLKPYEACVAANTGHIATHETGAIENTGHKVLTVDSPDGKISAEKIREVLDFHINEHMVKPRLIYVSNPTELGTVYSYEELKSLSDFCKKSDLIFYVDGARIGAAISLPEANLSLKKIYDLADAFFIGGTKNGAFLGEALVIGNESLKKDFRFNIKQNGALLAKSRLLGIQFEELFKENLYFELAEHANKMANILSNELKNLGIEFLIESPTNQIFPILDNALVNDLSKAFNFLVWSKVDDNRSAIRLITSWATKEEKIRLIVDYLKNALDK